MGSRTSPPTRWIDAGVGDGAATGAESWPDAAVGVACGPAERDWTRGAETSRWEGAQAATVTEYASAARKAQRLSMKKGSDGLTSGVSGERSESTARRG